MAEINECDFCGDEFSYLPDPELEEQDYCVCVNCVDVAREQLDLNMDLYDPDEENDFEGLEDSPFFKGW